MKILGLFALTACLLASTGCAYMNISVPLDTDLDRTELGSKTGESEFQSILALVAWGDASTQAAAKDGNITTLNHADQEVLSVLFGLYYRQRTVVYGD
jgi:hypothetical protein